MGFGPATGTFTGVTANNFSDSKRTETDGTINSFWIQDTTVSGGSISRVSSWTQSNAQGTLVVAWPVLPAVGDSYELSVNSLSFPELRRAINSGIALCGRKLRTLVRDESQSLVSNTYQYTPNYDPASANAFFPRGVDRVSFLWWVGQTTREFTDVNFSYIDDSTIQLDDFVVDAYAGDTIRFQGMGPLTQRLKTDDPAQTIATFNDEFMIDALVWACVNRAWMIAGAKKSAGESQFELAMAQDALQQHQATMESWRRGPTVKARMDSPIHGGGWTP